MTPLRNESYTALKSPNATTYPPSPPLSHHSQDSEDSLRALEVEVGFTDTPERIGRGRSYSISGFDFHHDLLPLSASLSEPETTHGEGGEKSITLINGIALVVGLQIGSGILCGTRFLYIE
jgi:hypothetical protein